MYMYTLVMHTVFPHYIPTVYVYTLVSSKSTLSSITLSTITNKKCPQQAPLRLGTPTKFVDYKDFELNLVPFRCTCTHSKFVDNSCIHAFIYIFLTSRLLIHTHVQCTM